MLKNQKIELANNLRKELESSSVVVLLEHGPLTFSALDEARRDAAENTIIRKVKNNLARNAFVNSNYEVLNEHLKNERLLILSDDLFKACRSARFLLDKNKGQLKILKGASSKDVYEGTTLVDLASINSIEELQSKLLRVIKVVGENVLRVIKAKNEQ
jgi:ribosomal protein L10